MTYRSRLDDLNRNIQRNRNDILIDDQAYPKNRIHINLSCQPLSTYQNIIKPSIVPFSASGVSNRLEDELLLNTILAAIEQIKHNTKSNMKLKMT